MKLVKITDNNIILDEIKKLVDLCYTNLQIIDELKKSNIQLSVSTICKIKKKLNIKSLSRSKKCAIYKCLNCGIDFKCYINDNRKYCSRKCSVIINNSMRKHSIETKEKISKSLIKSYSSRVDINKNNKNNSTHRKCRNCDSIVSFRKIICETCRVSYYKYYRKLANFDFNVYDYPDEFNIDIIKKYGWYLPSNKGNNLGGVSRDHLYSVKYGFLNKVPLDIIKHPANCQIILHKDNNTKKTKCEISIDELLDRIRIWDIKYNKKF